MKPFYQASLILFSGSFVVMASQPRSFERTLTVDGIVDLDVRTDPGGITVTRGVDQSVRIRGTLRSVYGRFDFGTADDNIRALQQNPPIEQSGNRIRIGYAKNPDLLNGISMTLEIEVPRATRVRAMTDSGGIRIDGVSEPVKTETSSGGTEITGIGANVDTASHSGAIAVRNSGGDVSARNRSGGIQIAGVRGSVEAETTSGRTEISDVSGTVLSTVQSGSISVDNAKGGVTARNSSGSIDAFQVRGPVHAETSSGAIRIAQISPASIRARAGSGAIKVELASQGGYRIDAQSDSGKVSGPATRGPQQLAGDHRLRGMIGAGGPLVDLNTQSSKIEID